MARRAPAWRHAIVWPSKVSTLLLSERSSSSSATTAVSITEAHRALPEPSKARIVLSMSWRRALCAAFALAVCVLPGRVLADTVHYVPAFHVNALDTTGAGDVFRAGFIYALLRGAAPGMKPTAPVVLSRTASGT